MRTVKALHGTAALLAACLMGSSVHASGPKAGDVLYQIQSVDPKAGTITIDSGQNVQALRVRADATVTLNGTPDSLKDLQPGMTTKVRLAEPGVAIQIDASGSAAAQQAAMVADPNFVKALTAAKWTYDPGKPPFDTVEFTAGGRANVTDGQTSWHWEWTYAGPQQLKIVTRKMGTFFFQFDQGVTKYSVRGNASPGGHIIAATPN